jgi:hypothetical protein
MGDSNYDSNVSITEMDMLATLAAPKIMVFVFLLLTGSYYDKFL